MNCPNCTFANSPTAKFCAECGARLPASCPRCGAVVSVTAKFCSECGAPSSLTGAAAALSTSPVPTLEGHFATFQRSLPASLREQVFDDAEGENRVVTILFVDLSGSVAATAGLDPEETAARLNDVLKLMVDAILKYEGRINSLLGDGVLAFFGTPVAHENDPERAILAALEIREALQRLGLNSTAGINTGDAYVGTVGSERHHEFAARGLVINLAARLQGRARPGQIIVGETTYRLTRRAFEFAPLSLEIKGLDAPVAAHEVLRPLPHPEKVRGIEGARAALIGREHELETLKEVLANLLAGQGQMVSIIGEAGVGKSRLTTELKALSTAEGPLWLEGRCLDVGMAVTYWPFLDVFRTYLGWGTDDDESTRAQRIVSCLQDFVAGGDLSQARADEIGPLLGHLLSVRFGTEWDKRLQHAEPEQLKHRTFLAIRDFFVALTRRQPVALVLEDLHWSDSLSLDVIAVLMEVLTLAPLLLVCVYRPERQHKCWHLGTIAGRKCPERYTEVQLRELTPQQSRRLVEELLQIEALPAAVKDLILAKAQGNPFFVEEVVRSLIDSGLVFQDEASGGWQARERIETASVPESIQSVILSRVDRLEEHVRHTLQSASVIGRLFRRRLLERVDEQESAVDRALWELEDRALIYEERVIPEEQYSFQHVLTQETVYHSILRRRRAVFHQKVAEAIEVLDRDNLDEYYEQLAHHYTQSGAMAKAIKYLRLAGEKALDRNATQEALGQFERALELAEGSEHYDALLARRGRALTDLFRGQAAVRDYEQLLERAAARGDQRQELEAKLGLARAHYVLALDDPAGEHITRCRELYEAAYALARRLGDKRSMVQALLGTKWFHDFWPDYVPQQEVNAQEALTLSRDLGDETLTIDSRIYRLGFLRRGDAAADAEVEGDELIALLDHRRDLLRLNELYFSLMWSHRFWGNFERAVAICDAGIALAKELGVPPVQYPTLKALALASLGRYGDAWDALRQEVADDAHPFGKAMRDWGEGILLLELCAYERAISTLRGAIKDGTRLRRVWMQRSGLFYLTKALIRAGRFNAAAQQAIRQELETLGAALPPEVLSELRLSEGQAEEALEEARSAAAEAQASQRWPAHVTALELQARSLRRLGRTSEALAAADEALRLAESLSYVPLTWRVRATRAELLAAQGDATAATQEYAAAAVVIRALAQTLDDPALREEFLADGLVASVIVASNGSASSAAAAPMQKAPTP